MTEQTKEAKNKWVINENGRKTFWKRTNAAGLSQEDTHALFGVESMYDYEGDLTQAIKVIENYQASQLEGTAPQPPAPPAEPEPEAAVQSAMTEEMEQRVYHASTALPASPVWSKTRINSPNGFVWDVSIQAGLPMAEAKQSVAQTIELMKTFEAGAKRAGWLPVSNGRDVAVGIPAKTQATPSAPQPPTPGSAVPLPTTQAMAGNGNVEETESIMVTAPKGKPVVEFWRPGRQYPEVTWNLGGERLLELAPWLAANGWTPEHFNAIGASYDLKLSVHWVPSPKNPKWKDITAIEPR